jgi:hypothetical protein
MFMEELMPHMSSLVLMELVHGICSNIFLKRLRLSPSHELDLVQEEKVSSDSLLLLLETRLRKLYKELRRLESSHQQREVHLLQIQSFN